MRTKKIEFQQSIKKQREKSQSHSDAKPSEVTDIYWIEAKRMNGSKFTQHNNKEKDRNVQNWNNFSNYSDLFYMEM